MAAIEPAKMAAERNAYTSCVVCVYDKNAACGPPPQHLFIRNARSSGLHISDQYISTGDGVNWGRARESQRARLDLSQTQPRLALG